MANNGLFNSFKLVDEMSAQNTEFIPDAANVVDVTHGLNAPVRNHLCQPAGRAGAMTPSKFSIIMTVSCGLPTTIRNGTSASPSDDVSVSKKSIFVPQTMLPAIVNPKGRSGPPLLPATSLKLPNA